jgi:hypothetical protein
VCDFTPDALTRRNRTNDTVIPNETAAVTLGVKQSFGAPSSGWTGKGVPTIPAHRGNRSFRRVASLVCWSKSGRIIHDRQTVAGGA